jgi:hypothetical protein
MGCGIGVRKKSISAQNALRHDAPSRVLERSALYKILMNLLCLSYEDESSIHSAVDNLSAEVAPR